MGWEVKNELGVNFNALKGDVISNVYQGLLGTFLRICR